MGRLRTALTIAMRAGKPIRKAADIVKEGRAAWAAGRGARSGRTAASLADEIAMNAASKSNLARSGGGGMVPTGGSSMVGNRGGALMRQGSGGMTSYNPGGAMVRSGGAMTPYNPGGPLARTARHIPPVGLVPMFIDPGPTEPMIGPSGIPDIPDPSMVPRDPIVPSMTPSFTPTVPDVLPPPMMPRSPVPVSIPPVPDMPMTVPPNLEVPDVMPLAPRTPTMPDMSMGPPDITMPGFEAMFDDPDPTPGPMDLDVPEIDYGFLDSIEPLPAPSGGFHYRTPHPMPLPAYRRGY